MKIAEYEAFDLEFCGRLSKGTLVGAFAESPGMADRSERSRADLIEAHTKLRRDEIAQKVAKVFEGTAYLTDILVTPVASGGLALTPAGVESLAHASVAAE